MFKTLRTGFQTIAAGYLLVAAFLFLFFFWLKKGETYARGLSDPKWGLLIAAVLIFPFLLPVIQKYVLPRIRSIKVAEFLEISIREAEVTGYSEKITEELEKLPGDATLYQTVEMMYSYSSFILEAVKAVQQSREEVLVVDFREGKAWIPPNLYFLALLLRYRTRVRQIVFVETREAPRMFIGSSSPEELEEALGYRFPIFRTAAAGCDHQVLALNLDPMGVSGKFFNGLKGLYNQQEGSEEVRKLWLNSARLAELLEANLHGRRINSREKLGLEDYKLVLSSFQPFVPVVKDGRLDRFVSRDRLALRAARVALEKAAAD